MKKAAAPTKKRGRGRPPKGPGGRVFTAAYLPPQLVEKLDAYVKEMQKATKGASRGDVLAEALQTHRPFRLWLLARVKRLP